MMLFNADKRKSNADLRGFGRRDNLRISACNLRPPAFNMYFSRVLNKKSGFALVELLIVVFILGVVSAGLFSALNVGQFSYSLTSAKTGLQAHVRLAMDWITKDVRQAISWNLVNLDNNPTTTHIKFNLWNWDNVNNAWILSSAYIEYNYDGNLKKLTRTSVDEDNNTTALEFENIIEAPFYTTYIGPGSPSNELNVDQLRNNRKLIVVISGQKNIKGSLNANFGLKSEIKIRNG